MREERRSRLVTMYKLKGVGGGRCYQKITETLLARQFDYSTCGLSLVRAERETVVLINKIHVVTGNCDYRVTSTEGEIIRLKVEGTTISR